MVDSGYRGAMTEPETPQEGVAEALDDLGQQTRHLVRAEVQAARQEMWDRARQSAPTLALGGAAAVLGLCAGASSYRLSLRILERLTSPGAAAFLATAGYGAAAAWAGLGAARRLRELPVPLPVDTARTTGEAARHEA